MACFRCGRFGHYSSECYAKDSNFSEYSTTRKKVWADDSGIECYRCGRLGHFSSECYANLSRYSRIAAPMENFRTDDCRIECYHCGRLGHYSSECYAKDSSFSANPTLRKKFRAHDSEVECYRCGRLGHFSSECYANLSKPSRDPTSKGNRGNKRGGVYVLQFPGGYIYVGKSNDIDTRIHQHESGINGAACTARWRGIPREIEPITQRIDGDYESWERNETLARMQKHGIEKVRGWMYTEIEFTEETIESITSQLCEKYDRCRKCGQPGHFAADCALRADHEDDSTENSGSSEDDGSSEYGSDDSSSDC
jgi:hypothetical protein